jgi:S-adenosylmethionine:tRNA ribosyltransferase-isomerase
VIATPPVVSVGDVPEADRTPEDRGIARDQVRLLVTTSAGDDDRRFDDLPRLLRPHDLLVVNESATLPASLPARWGPEEFLVNLSTRYGPRLWLVETRRGVDRPGPVEVPLGEPFRVGETSARLIASYPGIPRLSFLLAEGDLGREMQRSGRPIRYGYLARNYPLCEYQTVFARVPGSAEMPSAGRPFTPRLLDRLRDRGVGFAPIVLHTGVSSLERGEPGALSAPIYPEPFAVPPATVDAIRHAHAVGGRVIAVGTTVVRALESAADGCGLRAARGFTSLYLRAGRETRVADGLLTGFHTDRSTHLDLLAAVADRDRLEAAYRIARARGYLWHEFGDSHLILAG